MNYLIKGGRVIDPLGKIDEALDIHVSGGVIDKLGKDLAVPGAEVISASGMIVAPGFIDMHTHLREPGREDKETVASGTRAAIRGGFITVTAMPNTEPAIDSPGTVRILREIISMEAKVDVIMVGAITKGREGKELTSFTDMKREGIVAVSDDGSSVEDRDLMLAALERAAKEDLLVIAHCEDSKLSSGGVMNKGFIATKMGLRGMPGSSEYERVKRDIELAKKASARIHIAHVSCRESVEIIRSAKASGVRVTAETCPHYFSLSEECCVTYDTNTKMNPPLRSMKDVEAIKEGLKDGTIDVISTDHAPHTDSEKDVEFDYAPFGIIGLETALSLGAMELVSKGVLSWPGLIEKMSSNPANILRLDKGSIKEGKPANLVILDPEKEYIYSKGSIESKSRNSPFIDWRLKGKAASLFARGKCAMKDGNILI